MRSFKKIILLLCIFVIVENVLSFALEPPTFAHYLEMDLKRTEDNQPDLVFIGNSRVSTSFIPHIFSKNIEGVECAFNAGTGSQGISGTYYYLKDILKQYDLKYVVVGLDYQTVLKEERVLKRDLIVLERIKSPIIKAQYMADVFKVTEYPYFFKSIQYKDNVWNILDNVKQKLSKEYREGIYVGSGMVYEDLGFARETKVLEQSAGINISQEWKTEKIDAKKLAYLDKIVELCRKENAELFLVSTPLTNSTVYATPGYEECVKYFQAYAEQNGIYYDNINLMLDRETLLPDTKMNCMEHVGGDGAEIVSEFYCRVLQNHIEGLDVSPFFYSTVTEMRNDMSDVVACSLFTREIEAGGDRRITGEVVCKEGAEVEYQFELTNETDTAVLQAYSQKTECLLPKEKITFPMVLRVKCRSVHNISNERVHEVVIEKDTWPGYDD